MGECINLYWELQRRQVEAILPVVETALRWAILQDSVASRRGYQSEGCELDNAADCIVAFYGITDEQRNHLLNLCENNLTDSPPHSPPTLPGETPSKVQRNIVRMAA